MTTAEVRRTRGSNPLPNQAWTRRHMVYAGTWPLPVCGYRVLSSYLSAGVPGTGPWQYPSTVCGYFEYPCVTRRVLPWLYPGASDGQGLAFPVTQLAG